MSEIGASDFPENPYRPPESDITPPIEINTGFLGEERASELTERTRYLAVEATMKTVGLIYVLTAGFSLLNIGVMIYSPKMIQTMTALAAKSGFDPATFQQLVIGSMIFGIVLVLLLGLGLRGLKNWARWILIVLGVIGLLSKLQYVFNPVAALQAFTPDLTTLTSIGGTVLSVVLVFLLFLPGADHVCSSYYRYVVSQTRQIRPTMGGRDKILLGAFLVIYCLGFVAGFF